MRFDARHKDRSELIEVEPGDNGQYIVTIGGVQHNVDARPAEGGAWTVLIDNDSFDVELEVAGEKESAGDYNALVRGAVVHLNVQDERKRRLGGAKKLAVEGPQVVAAPMPGKVVKILVEPGVEVGDGDPLIVIEAMKMENELRAPTAGKVATIFVEEGQTVDAHAKLIALE